MEVLRSYPIQYYQNYIYPNYYNPIENTKTFYNSIKNKIFECYNFIFDVKEAFIEMKRMEEYRELCEEQNSSLPGQGVLIYGDVKQD